jgi:hypothetical protein
MVKNEYVVHCINLLSTIELGYVHLVIPWFLDLNQIINDVANTTQ